MREGFKASKSQMIVGAVCSIGAAVIFAVAALKPDLAEEDKAFQKAQGNSCTPEFQENGTVIVTLDSTSLILPSWPPRDSFRLSSGRKAVFFDQGECFYTEQMPVSSKNLKTERDGDDLLVGNLRLKSQRLGP